MNTGQRILVVDDAPENLGLLAEALRRDGYHVEFCQSAAATFEALRTLPSPSLILLDIVMPDMDGHELYDRIRSDPEPGIARIPVIFLSALDIPQEKLKAFRKGAVDYIVKPFPIEEAVARVRTHTRLASLEELHREIAERQSAQAALRTSEERYRAILQSSLDGFWLVDPADRTILDANDAYCRMSGYSRQDLIGSRISRFEANESEAEIEAHTRKVEEQGFDRFESRHRRKDGSTFDVEISVQFLSIEGGRTVVFLRDISQRKAAEEDNLLLEAQLHQSRKMESVGRLAGGVAHDFNNMLSVILGHVELLRGHLPPEGTHVADIDAIHKAGRRSTDLTRQLLTFARKTALDQEVIDLNQATMEMLGMLRRLIGENISLEWRPQAGLWPVRLAPTQADQILVNLCVNARDAIADTGRIAIETRNCPHDSDCPNHHRCPARLGRTDSPTDDFVTISVTDDGCGMDEETIQSIFEPFFTTKPPGKGTGLGLSTVYGAAKQNGGFVGVRSSPDAGSTFTVCLPRHRGPQTVDASSSVATESVRHSGSGTILVVEDDASILGLAKAVLEQEGYTVLATESPLEALAIAKEHRLEIDLLLSDVIMPDLNGRELLSRLATIVPGIRHLFMSGYLPDQILRRGILVEGANFLQKPFSIRELISKIRHLVAERSACVGEGI